MSLNVTENFTNFLNSSVSNAVTDADEKCEYFLQCFRTTYILYHGYISVVICIFGIIANILNIVVLTRREMISSTNAILTGLAVSDMLVMVAFIIYSIHYYVPPDKPRHEVYTYDWAIFTLVYSHFSVIFHSISVWQTVLLAVWRYIAVCFPSKNIDWANMKRTKAAIASIYIISPILTIPNYFVFEVAPLNTTVIDAFANSTVVQGYMVSFSILANMNDRLLTKMCFWMYSVLMKLVPCILLTVLIVTLIRALYANNKRKMALKNRKTDDDKTHERVSGMLIAVLSIFIITESPGGILALLYCILGQEYYVKVYLNLGEVMDILAVFNSAVNFILYCTMSRHFRETFSKLFRPKFKKWQWISMNTHNPLPMTDGRTTVTYHTSCV